MGKRAAGLVIVRRFQGAIEYLLLQTIKKTHHWTPPKGHTEFDESEMKTAMREVAEETGFTEDDLKIFEDTKVESNYEAKGKPKRVVYWLAELVKSDADVRLSDEHQDFVWLGIEAACIRAEYEAMQKVLREMDKHVSEKLR